ncbi:hypothetical protein M3Y97_00314400 [Aphelenchoides bicaudatus]|nr:hypothetical protein M3Y97_00314400 [Aphelenchoides bicaudatus]
MHLNFRYGILVFLAGGIFTFIALSMLEHQTVHHFHNEIMERLGSNQWIHQMIDDYKCPSLIAGNQTKSEYDDAHNWSFSNERFFKRVNQSSNMHPLSKEEEEYPLAYGMIVYKDEAQVYLTVSAFYHPQHIFCIVVDGKSSPEFKRRIHQLDNCFPNIHVIEHEPIGWCEKNVLHAQYTCFRDLTLRDHPWKYYQYITGFDLPAKTNLETIRILKQLNGAAVAEVVVGGDISLDSEKSKGAPFKVWKSGMSAVISRQTADDIFKIEKNARQMDKLLTHLLSKSYIYRICNDELYWATVLGNKKAYNITGSFSAHDLVKNKLQKWKMPINISRNVFEEPYVLRTGLLGRYQR